MRFAPRKAGRQTPLPSYIVTAEVVIRKRSLDERAATARAGASGTAEAMIASQDFEILHFFQINIPEMKATSFVIAPLHLEHLIEVTIEHFAPPADADRVAAHQSLNRRGVKGVLEQRHVLAHLIVVSQPGGETGDREIGDRVELVEDNPEVVP